MPTTTEPSPWDFTAVYDLVNSFAIKDVGAEDLGAPNSQPSTVTPAANRQSTGLGDFGPLWEFLHVEQDNNLLERAVDLNSKPTPNPPSDELTPLLHLPSSINDETYTSDGAAYAETSFAATKNVTWNDELDVLEASEEPTTMSDSNTELETPSRPSRGKKQKEPQLKTKKAAKAAARAAKAARKAARKQERKSRSDVESEAEIRILKKPSPAKKASVHSRPGTPKSDSANTSRYNLRSSDTPPVTPNGATPGDSKTTLSQPSTVPSNLAHALKAEAVAHDQQVFDKQTRSILVPAESDALKSKSKLPNEQDMYNVAAGALDEVSGEGQPGKSTPRLPMSAVNVGASSGNLIPASVTPKAQSVGTPNRPKNASAQVPGYLASLTPNKQGQVPFPYPLHTAPFGHQHSFPDQAQYALPAAQSSRFASTSSLPQHPSVNIEQQQYLLLLHPHLTYEQRIALARQYSGPELRGVLLQQPFAKQQHVPPSFFGPSIVNSQLPHDSAPPYMVPLLQQSYNSLTSLSSKNKKFNIMPKEDRDLHLFLRLVHDFPQDKKWLTKPVHLVDHLAAPKGIHIFVDFSNIWISFMEHLKLLQFSLKQKLPHQNISFDSLVLLLERHRPVSKRVLAGSYPLMPAMTLAKAIGYETNILDKVYKARELTGRQKRFQVTNTSRRGYPAPMQHEVNAVGGNGDANNGNGNTSSGSETCVPPSPAVMSNSNANVTNNTTAAIPVPTSSSSASLQQLSSPKKWVEQCVDELLHLKMLESIVDSEEPSTMVVATGDAAEAEYSGGFMKMILRALKKGWQVELVAWEKSISARYRDHAFQREWADNGVFRIIELDGYAEYLLDT